MRSRTKSRILAMMMLHSLEIQRLNSPKVARAILSMFNTKFKQTIEDFASHLMRGVLENKKEIDELILENSKNWDFKRISKVDLQIMRIALFEFLYEKKTSPPICINEAVDIAKLFSTDESGHYINGILDKINKNQI